ILAHIADLKIIYGIFKKCFHGNDFPFSDLAKIKSPKIEQPTNNIPYIVWNLEILGFFKVSSVIVDYLRLNHIGGMIKLEDLILTISPLFYLPVTDVWHQGCGIDISAPVVIYTGHPI